MPPLFCPLFSSQKSCFGCNQALHLLGITKNGLSFDCHFILPYFIWNNPYKMSPWWRDTILQKLVVERVSWQIYSVPWTLEVRILGWCFRVLILKVLNSAHLHRSRYKWTLYLGLLRCKWTLKVPLFRLELRHKCFWAGRGKEIIHRLWAKNWPGLAPRDFIPNFSINTNYHLCLIIHRLKQLSFYLHRRDNGWPVRIVLTVRLVLLRIECDLRLFFLRCLWKLKA